MKNRFSLLSFLFLSLSLLFFVTCNPDDDSDQMTETSVIKGGGLSVNNDSLRIGSQARIAIKAVKGGKALNTITVQANGVNLVPGTFNVNGVASTANPALLFGGDRDSLLFTYDFARVDTPQIVSYVFTIKDEGDRSVSDTVNIIYYGTPASEVGKNLIVYNYSGTKFGGLDLFNVKVVSGNAPEATIRDYGVNDPVSDKTWVMRFVPLNNSEIMNPPANISYAGLIYKENIQRAFELGSREPGIVSSKVLAKGDYFLVKNGTTYFAVYINNASVTANDNNDYFDVSIKR